MRIFGTGHRPNKLGGYGDDVFLRLKELAKDWLQSQTVDVVISGMALGWDQALAETALELGLPLICALPCLGQELVWPRKSQERYRKILKQSYAVVRVTESSFSKDCMQKRNEWMVDTADLGVALWDGSPGGGTANCIRYANRKGVPIENLWEKWTCTGTNG